MTFVGKILVILIMAFALIFLGVSTVVFTTATAWKDKSTLQAKNIQEIQTQLTTAKAQVGDAEAKHKTAKEDHTKVVTERENRIKDLERQVTEAEGQMAQARGELETAQKNAQVSLAEATARKGEIDVLNTTLGKAQNQANSFSAQNIELTDQIRVLEREKTTAEQNAKDLREFVGRVTAFLRLKGIPFDNFRNFNPGTSPEHPVDGRIMALNSTRRSMEISIGSDDGIAVGQELFAMRTQPRGEFLGRVKIVSVYPDKAVADVVSTVNGKKIQEGDIVSSTLGSR